MCTSFTCVKPQKPLAFGKRENIANYKLPSLLLLLLSEKSKEIFSLISRPTLLQQHMREKHFDSKTFTFLSEDFHLVLDVMCSLHSFLIPFLSLSLAYNNAMRCNEIVSGKLIFFPSDYVALNDVRRNFNSKCNEIMQREAFDEK